MAEYVLWAIPSLTLILCSILFFHFYKKYGVELYSGREIVQVKEIPFKDKPYVVDYLLNLKATTNGMVATLMDLFLRKHIKIERVESESVLGMIFKGYDYKLSRLESNGPLAPSEQALLDLIFIRKVRTGWFSTSKIPSNDVTISGIILRQEQEETPLIVEWARTAEAEVRTNHVVNDFYNFTGARKFKMSLIALEAALIALLLAGIFAKIPELAIGAVYSIPIVFLFLLITALAPRILSKMTYLGAEHYIKWLGYKKFLTDFHYLEKKIPEDITLWEEHLVYATVCGNAETVLREFSYAFEARKEPKNHAVVFHQ
ncbi:MAG: DUF2207 domain-containing protein [Candidatus Diapherotrites archaeon]|nr:DUF2207 domain-containing protein [Candidatus Diapherotrites archaeon]